MATADGLCAEHRDHLLDELGPDGLVIAVQLGARTIDADEAHRMGFRFGRHRTGGLLLPFGSEFAQLRCDDPPTTHTGDRVKYLNRLGVSQCPSTVGTGEPTIATEGLKDAIALYLLTGETVQAIAGVAGWPLLSPSVRLLIYDADAALNPGVWGPLVAAGLQRTALRLAFWPASIAGAKGGACEFRNAGGDLATVTRHKARELLRYLPTLWDQHLRVDWKLKALRRLAALAMKAYPGDGTAQLLLVDAAKRIGVPVEAARKQLAAVAQQVDPPDPEQPPEEPTKQELQRFLRSRHRLRFDDLRQSVEIDGRPMDELDLADSFLAHLYGIETTKQAARDSFLYVAVCNRFNPVREWLEALPRSPGLRLLPLPQIAAAFGIAPGDTLSQELLARHLAGGYRRGMEPGYKHDQVLLMQGEQGQLKGQTIAALAPPGMADSTTKVPKGLEDREFLGKLNSCWVFEFDEVEKVLQGRDAAEFKGFASRRIYRYVQKWETVCRDHPARALLFATTNAREVLNDHTGNRRIWVVPVGPCNPAWVRENRASIWATVATWVAWGLESFIPEGHPTAVEAANRALGVQISDAWEGKLREQLEALVDPQREGIALDDLARQALGIEETERITRDVQMRMTRLITGAGFTTHDGRLQWQQQRRRYGGGQSRSGYMPIPVPAFQPRCDDSWGSWNGQKPWQDSDLNTLFQPFQPFREGEDKERDRDKGVCGRMGVPSSAGDDMQGNVGTVGTPPQTPSAPAVPGVPTGQEDGAFNGTPLERHWTTVASDDPKDIKPDDQVEVRQRDGSWRNGYRAASRARDGRVLVTNGTESLLRALDEVRACSSQLP
ncbi:VapE domain-containing protein [Synechococcus sp. FACHB-909]|uniref:VapE domain-containing protein n=1 Tax=Synechococcus sp. FACHB-909 TaxID=2692863 RepID=UPI001682E54E|nr:VapE domain-containing protein [Synechococcus sp. FACHB-909]MBD2718105.1 hypothetical protein [Synechococcus sp. FACHB-909]